MAYSSRYIRTCTCMLLATGSNYTLWSQLISHYYLLCKCSCQNTANLIGAHNVIKLLSLSLYKLHYNYMYIYIYTHWFLICRYHRPWHLCKSLTFQQIPLLSDFIYAQGRAVAASAAWFTSRNLFRDRRKHVKLPLSALSSCSEICTLLWPSYDVQVNTTVNPLSTFVLT